MAEATREQVAGLLAEGIVLSPGDKILLAMRAEITGEQLQDLAFSIHENFPLIDFTIVANVESVLVEKKVTAHAE